MNTVSAMICPVCKGQLELDPNSSNNSVQYLRCPSCGTYVAVTNENVKTNIINKTIRMTKENIDHTKIAKYEYLKYRDQYGWKLMGKLWKLIGKFCLVLILFFILSILLISQIDKNEKKHIKIAQEQGLICATNSDNYKGKHYKEVEKQLEDMGFKNIETLKLHDAESDEERNKIVSVSINGRTSFKYSDYFNPEDSVLITYH